MEFPLPPAPGKEFNFTNGMGVSYEAKHVQECLQKGKDVEDGVGGWQGGRASPVGEMDIFPTPQPLKQLFRTTSPRNLCGIHMPEPCISVPHGILGIVVLLVFGT